MAIDPTLDIKLMSFLVEDEDKRKVLQVVASRRLLRFRELSDALAKDGINRDRVQAAVRELGGMELLGGFESSSLPEDSRSVFATAKGFSAGRRLSKLRFTT